MTQALLKHQPLGEGSEKGWKWRQRPGHTFPGLQALASKCSPAPASEVLCSPDPPLGWGPAGGKAGPLVPAGTEAVDCHCFSLPVAAPKPGRGPARPDHVSQLVLMPEAPPPAPRPPPAPGTTGSCSLPTSDNVCTIFRWVHSVSTVDN